MSAARSARRVVRRATLRQQPMADTTVVVTFVLVPAKIKNGTSAAHFFHWDELVMHNANSFLLIFDLVAVGALHVRLADLPWSAMVGVTYTVFHHYIRYPRTRTLLYFFLNWQVTLRSARLARFALTRTSECRTARLPSSSWSSSALSSSSSALASQSRTCAPSHGAHRSYCFPACSLCASASPLQSQR